MIYRIKQGSNRCDGSDVFRIYRVEGTDEHFLNSEATLEAARKCVQRLANPKTETTIEDIKV